LLGRVRGAHLTGRPSIAMPPELPDYLGIMSI
jgi:hypothetical protein